MISLAELVLAIEETDQQTPEELWPTNHQQTLPVLRRLIQEIDDDQILGEAALCWVRQKKQEFLAAKLNSVYSPEQLEELRRKAENADDSVSV